MGGGRTRGGVRLWFPPGSPTGAARGGQGREGEGESDQAPGYNEIESGLMLSYPNGSHPLDYKKKSIIPTFE